MEFIETLRGHGVAASAWHQETEECMTSVGDFSPLKLNVSHMCPIIALSERAADLGSSGLLQLVTQALDSFDGSHALAFVLAAWRLSDEDRLALETDVIRQLVILDQEQQEHVAQAKSPLTALVDTLVEQVPIEGLLPYETSRPVVGGRFFGREQELRRLMLRPQASSALVGVRLMGKTSLLYELRRRLSARAEGKDRHIILLDCMNMATPQQFLRAVVTRLSLRDLPRLSRQVFQIYYPDFMRRMSSNGRHPITVLLDEVDDLVHNDSVLWEWMSALRVTANQGFCRYVMCGYHDLASAVQSGHTPAFNFLDNVPIRPFTRSDTEAIVLRPLERLHVKVQRRSELVNRVYHETAGHPNLIQYYCLVLASALDDQPSQTVSPSDLDRVYASEAFKDRMINAVLDYTDVSTHVCLYAIAANADLDGGFSLSAVDAELRKNNVVLSLSDLEAALRDLVHAAALTPQRRDAFRYTAPVLPVFLREETDLRFRLTKAKRELAESGGTA